MRFDPKPQPQPDKKDDENPITDAPPHFVSLCVK